MIHEVEGDLLLSRAQALVHGVAPLDDFGQGLALALRERWPAMVRDFRHWCHVHHPKPGGLWTWGGAGGVRIVNLLTQDAAAQTGGHPGRAHVEYVNHALRALRKAIHEENFDSVALPRLATGVGGLDWQVVAPLVHTHLQDLTIPIYLYVNYRKGVQAKEPSLPLRNL